MPRTSYDQLMKHVLQAYFSDFLHLFEPAIAAGLDLDAGVAFRDLETFSDIPQGKLLVADIVADVRTRDGQPRVIIVHIEIQREREGGDFARRMWRYYTALVQREDKPIIPIALVFYRTRAGITWETYREALFGHTISTFQYLQISLPRLDPFRYLQTGNVLAAGLASMMGPTPRGAKRVALHDACVRRVIEVERAGVVDRARLHMLADLIETHLPVTLEQREKLGVQLPQGGDRAMEATELTWASRIDLEASVRTRRDYIKKVIRARFGRVTPEVEAAIDGTDSEDDLDGMHDLALVAQSESELLPPAHQ